MRGNHREEWRLKLIPLLTKLEAAFIHDFFGLENDECPKNMEYFAKAVNVYRNKLAKVSAASEVTAEDLEGEIEELLEHEKPQLVEAMPEIFVLAWVEDSIRSTVR